jgi:hypothetical protein
VACITEQRIGLFFMSDDLLKEVETLIEQTEQGDLRWSVLERVPRLLRALRDRLIEQGQENETEPQRDQMKDALQFAFNRGAFPCPMAGRQDKPKDHAWACISCRVRGWLTPGWFLISEERSFALAESYRAGSPDDRET